MRRPLLAAIALIVFHLARPPSGTAARLPASPDPGGVLKRLSIASFAGSGQNSIQALATDPSGNIYVAGTTSSPDFPVHNAAQQSFGDARIMRTLDRGTTWTRVGSPPQDVIVVVPDPVAPLVFFAGGDTGIYKSTNGGQAWRLVYQFPTVGYQFSGALAIDPGNHLRLAALTPLTGALVRSLDGGETWVVGQRVCPLSSCGGQLFADPTGSGTLLVSSFILSISNDWGATLRTLAPPGGGGTGTAAFDPSHPGWIYAAGMLGVSGNLSLSTDYGATWTVKGSPPSPFNTILNLAVDPDQPTTLIAATFQGFYKSTDGATSWARAQGAGVLPNGHVPFAILSHSCGPGGGLFEVGGRQQVAFSPDYGATLMTPQLSQVTSVTAGPACAVYITRTTTTDAFVAKLAPDGSTLWATFLGGSDQEVPVALAVDTQGNAYLTGNTGSPDFPATVPRIGVAGQNSVFVTKFSPDGQLVYSVLVGGESSNTASAIAVDGLQNAYVVGATNSVSFPVTPGTLVTSLQSGPNAGFLVKLSSTGGLVYATFTGDSSAYPSAVLVDTAGSVILAGAGGVPGIPAPPPYGRGAFLMKFDPAASQIVSATYLPQGQGASQGPTALAADAQGNLFVLGLTYQPDSTPGAYHSPPPPTFCAGYRYSSAYSGNVYLTKLAAADWQPIYGALLGGQCGTQSGAIAVDSTGAVVFAVAAGPGFPLHNPLLAGPTCGVTSSAIAKLSPDGSTLEFGTYLDDCGVPGIAVAGDGTIYAGVTHGVFSALAGVLHLALSSAPAVSLERIANAFSGDAAAIVRGGLYSIEGSGFPAAPIDLSLNPSQDLPTRLGGIQVKFDGVLAQILQVSPDRVIVVAPGNGLVPPARRAQVPGFTSVQVIYNGDASDTVWMPVAASLPGLLTRDFPNLRPYDYANIADANARNEDGSLNDADHPAAAGSTITLFGTGLGLTSPPVFAYWNYTPDPETVSPVPGFVAALLQIRIKVPKPLGNLGGATLSNGVQRVPAGLLLTSQYLSSSTFPLVSNLVAVYLK